MPDLTSASKIQTKPLILDYYPVGTVAGTAILFKESAYLGKINITSRVASGARHNAIAEALRLLKQQDAKIRTNKTNRSGRIPGVTKI